MLLTTRVREPLDHYLSTYRWATGSKYNLGLSTAKPRFRTDAAGQHYAILPAPTFVEWAPRNLQSRLLLHGGAKGFVTDEQSGRVKKEDGTKPEPTPEQFEQALSALSKDFDVFVPLERFDEMVGTVARFLGVPLNHSALSYERVSPRNGFYGGGLMGEARARAIAQTCPNISRCEEHVRRLAPFDHQLYQWAAAAAAAATSPNAAATAAATPGARTFERAPSVVLPQVSGTGSSPRCAPDWILRSPPPSRRKDAMTLRLQHECHEVGAGGLSLSNPRLRSHAARSAGGGSGSGTSSSSSSSSSESSRSLAAVTSISTAKGANGAGTTSALEAAFATFFGVCLRTTSVESYLEAKDVARDYAGGGDGGSSSPLRGVGSSLVSAPLSAAPSFSSSSSSSSSSSTTTSLDSTCAPAIEHASRYRDALNDDACGAEVRCVFYFAPPPPSSGGVTRWVGLPLIEPSPCNIALVDNTTRFGVSGGGEQGWTLRRIPMAKWPFPADAPRSAHYLKVIAPLIFPNARVVLAGDVKCAGSNSALPCKLMRPPANGDLRVAKNRWYKSRSVEGEFISTWRHMRLRSMPSDTFREMSSQLSAYEREGYDMDRIHL